MAVSYAEPADLLVHALPSTAYASFASAKQEAALEWASRFADSYLADRFAVPLTTWDMDLTACVCDLAAYRLLTSIGFDSTAEGSAFRKRYEDAVEWLKGVPPTGVDDGEQATGVVAIHSNVVRGW